jgi:hypothetical protein
MNSLLAKVTGRIQEDDVVPVPAGALTRRTYRDRMIQQRQGRRGEDEDSAALKRVVGEAKEGIIPDNAEEINDMGLSVLPKTMKPIKDVVQEPSHPSGDREKLMTPYAALTAPDATPGAMTPLDPSKVPGSTTQTFTAAELEKAEPEQEVTPEEIEGPGVDKATRAMDVILGRTRAGKPATDLAGAERAGAITSEAAAYAALRVAPPGMAETVGAAMVPGTPMPEPTAGDGKMICEAFRRFMG